ncbi:hypothetical protein DN53_00220 [Flagellimonas olearia]|uniref:Fibronectin type-III domain-containing protein n=1 Tax=Flagellimonas olearia TaxID=552546 RepID=A0A444VPP5_9FLAO|nr:hypothetical protein DN53_00220 [Allomuricauda olearia]
MGTLPTNGEPCSDYSEVSGDDTKVLILFKWNAAESAQNYNLIISESGSEVTQKNVNGLETTVPLDRGKTYAWQVNAINSDGETNSNTYSFTTPGIPEGNYAPYAAQISVEFITETSEMLVSWVGEDEDGDILSYDVVIFWEGTTGETFTGLMETTLETVSYIPSTAYTVQVTSKETSGNFSISIVEGTTPE